MIPRTGLGISAPAAMARDLVIASVLIGCGVVLGLNLAEPERHVVTVLETPPLTTVHEMPGECRAALSARTAEAEEWEAVATLAAARLQAVYAAHLADPATLPDVLAAQRVTTTRDASPTSARLIASQADSAESACTTAVDR